jgi:dTDP-4-amino-4,6-dideoxygalactose transaminase
MDVICEIARRHGLAVIEDNAHGLFGAYKGRQLGTIGDFATLSFHETKNFSCGEGGALIVNAPAYADRAEIIREKGTDRSRFFRGQVDKYTWVGLGSSYLVPDLSAAILLAQLEQRGRIQARRAELVHAYQTQLTEWANDNHVQLPRIPAWCEPAHHLFAIVMPSLAARQALIAHLQSSGILAVFHYVPLHLSEMGKSLGYEPGVLPVTERTSERLVRLPLFADMRNDDIAEVVEVIKKFRA